MTINQLTPEISVDQYVGESALRIIFRKRLKHFQVAARMEMSTASFSKSLHGVRPWRVEEVLRLADVLEVPVVDLLPHKDSNLEPSDYRPAQVRGVLPRRLRLVG